jgi:hypothetical protein
MNNRDERVVVLEFVLALVLACVFLQPVLEQLRPECKLCVQFDGM